MRFLSRTPIRTFFIYPVLVIAWEHIWNRGSLDPQPVFLLLMAWGYLQYRLCGFIASNMMAAVQVSKHCRTASSQPDLTPTAAIRCISVI